MVCADDQQVAPGGRLLAPSGNLGRQARRCRHHRSAVRGRDRQQSPDTGTELRSIHPELPWPRRRDGYGEPQSQLPRQFCGVVRDGVTHLQGGYRSEWGHALGRHQFRRPLQLRCQHARQQRGGIGYPGAAKSLAPLRWLHRSTDPSGQRRPGRREHVDSALLSDSRLQQGEQRGRRLRAGQMEHRSGDHQRGTPFRLVQFLEPRVPPWTVNPDAQSKLRRTGFRHHPLQGLDTQARCVVGCLWRWKDRTQGQLRQVRARPGVGRRRPGESAWL